MMGDVDISPSPPPSHHISLPPPPPSHHITSHHISLPPSPSPPIFIVSIAIDKNFDQF